MKKLKNVNTNVFIRLGTVLFAFLILTVCLKAQTQECIVYDNTSQELTTPPQTCGLSIDYAPSADNPEQTPVKWVRMVWHFMCDDNGQGNFNDVDITNASHNNQSAFWVKLMNELNSRMRGLAQVNRQDPSFPTPHIPDSRIQFDIQQSNIFYHNNTSQMNNPNGWDSHYNQYVTNNSSMTYKSDALHVFFYPNTYGSGTSWAYLFGNEVAHNGDWAIFNDPGNTNNSLSWLAGGSLLHEMLHCLGLNHTNRYGSGGCNTLDNDGCDDTPVGGSLNPCPCWNGNAADGLPCSNNVMTYNASKNALSRCQLGKLHYNLIHSSNVNAYLIEDFCSHQATETITIQSGQNFTWENTRYLKGDLIVESGATLTIKCFVSFANSSKVYIKAGGKLIVDGGTLTTICGTDWEGVIVEGNKNLPQNDASQGVIELKNGAVIEYARDAIILIGLKTNGDFDWNTTGGIVRAKNATFLNNRRDAGFVSYHSYAMNGAEYSNTSYFEKCNFLTDDNEHGAYNFTAHITMWNVNGVSISGCVFEDQRSGVILSTDGRVGIYTISASFRVAQYCGATIPCSGPRSKFINLKQGIESYNLSNPQRTIYISGSDFDSYRGAALTGINQAVVYNNTFELEVTMFSPLPYFFPVGLYLDQSTGFRVYENTFNGNANPSNYFMTGAAGLVVRRSGANNDNFYNNTFTQLITASQSIGFNRDNLGTKGLTFRCNDYNDNFDDFFVTKYATDPGPHNQAGIHPLQGFSLTGASQAADNLFGNSSPILNYNIENMGTWINYAHRDPATVSRTKPSITTSNVTLFQLAGNRVCNTSYNGMDVNAQWNTVNSFKPLVLGKRQYYWANVDGGNTPNRLTQVQTADVNTVNTVYNDIMNDAPWVSNDVLLEIAAAGGPFSNEMITDILVACPQASRSVDIQTTLDERLDPLSQQERGEIDDAQATFTDFDDFIQEWAYYSSEYQTAINNILHEYFADENADHMTELDIILKDGDNINNYYLLAEIYFSKGMNVEAGNVLAIIPATFTLSVEQQSYHNDFVVYYNTLNQWALTQKDLTSLDPVDISWLESFGQNKEVVFARSVGLLKLNEESDYYGEVYIPQVAGASLTRPTSVNEPDDKQLLKVYPNPAMSNLFIESETAIQSLSVQDMLGREVVKLICLDKGKHTINVSQLPVGVYILSIESNGIKTNHKFIKE